MITSEKHTIIDNFQLFLKNREFPCIAAKAALAKAHVKCLVADHMSCPKDDCSILQFLYDFTDAYRQSTEFYHSAAIIFKEPTVIAEELFDTLLWQRLQALTNLDAAVYPFDKRVNNSPTSPNFSFSIKEEAYYVIGLHANSSRLSRRFIHPTLVFNPHRQFEELKDKGKFEIMKKAVRKRDLAYSGSINPMLEDFGVRSEVFQYSGLKYDKTWQCPLKINHAATDNNSTP